MPVQINGTTGVTTNKITFGDTTSFATNNAIPRPVTAANGQVLTYNGSTWVAQNVATGGSGTPTGTASGDLGGTYPGPSVTKIQGIPISNVAPGNGQVLTYNGSSWVAQSVATGGSSTPIGAASGDLGGSYPGPSVAKIQGVPVSNTTPTTGQTLTYNGTAWSASTPPTLVGGDLTGNLPNPSVTKIRGVPISTVAPGNGQVLTYNGTAWAAQNVATGGSGTPIGTASGDLGGSYPGPSVTRIQGVPVLNTTPTTGQTLTYNGTAWSASTPSTSVGGDLTGNLPNPSVTKIRGIPVLNTIPIPGQTLIYNGSGWVSSTPPTSVGGDLTGNLPNPLVTKIQGVPVSSTTPTVGQALIYDGATWAARAVPNSSTTGTTIDGSSITSNLTTYLLKLADSNKVMLCNNTSSLTITIPANVFNVGTEIILIQRGGTVTISAGSGVTIESNGNKFKTKGTSAGACLIHIQNNIWFLGGNTTN